MADGASFNINPGDSIANFTNKNGFKSIVFGTDSLLGDFFAVKTSTGSSINIYATGRIELSTPYGSISLNAAAGGFGISRSDGSLYFDTATGSLKISRPDGSLLNISVDSCISFSKDGNTVTISDSLIQAKQ